MDVTFPSPLDEKVTKLANVENGEGFPTGERDNLKAESVKFSPKGSGKVTKEGSGIPKLEHKETKGDWDIYNPVFTDSQAENEELQSEGSWNVMRDLHGKNKIESDKKIRKLLSLRSYNNEDFNS